MNQHAFTGPLAATIGHIPLAEVLLDPDACLPVPPADDRSVWDATTGTAHHATIDAVIERARNEQHEAWPLPLASAAARVHRDGNRVNWETPAFARQHRLSRVAVAAAVTQEDAWIDEVADGVTLLCEQSSWCWPAHDDTRERHGAILATVTDPCLDLGAGEAVAQLAWIDQLLGNHLDGRYPGLRSRIRHEASVRVIDPFLRRRDWHWIGLDGDVHNWNPWIHGNVLVAALRLLDPDDPRRVETIELCVEGLDRYIAALPADGAIDEGYSYWWNGACRALEALDVLTHATRGVIDPMPEVEALRETIAFPLRCALNQTWYLNLGDGQARPPRDQAWDSAYRAAVHTGNAAAAAHALAQRGTVEIAHELTGLGRLLRGVTDRAWQTAPVGTAPLPETVWLPSTQVLLVRERHGSPRGLALSVKGGHNDEHHNHNDVGSFIVASDGVPVLIDPGRPTYTKQTFGPERYDIWTMQSAWHNVPRIGGVDQSAGRSFTASEVAPLQEGSRVGLTLDLAGAYPDSPASSWRRTALLDRATSTVEITDVWEIPAESPAPTELHLVVAGEVTLTPSGADITPLDQASPVRLTWPEGIGSRVEVRPLDDPMLSTVWGAKMTRITLDVSSRTTATITVRTRQNGENP